MRKAACMREEKGFQQPAALCAASRGVVDFIGPILVHVHDKWKRSARKPAFDALLWPNLGRGAPATPGEIQT
jgi:hypothetical protein